MTVRNRLFELNCLLLKMVVATPLVGFLKFNGGIRRIHSLTRSDTRVTMLDFLTQIVQSLLPRHLIFYFLESDRIQELKLGSIIGNSLAVFMQLVKTFS